MLIFAHDALKKSTFSKWAHLIKRLGCLLSRIAPILKMLISSPLSLPFPERSTDLVHPDGDLLRSFPVFYGLLWLPWDADGSLWGTLGSQVELGMTLGQNGRPFPSIFGAFAMPAHKK